MTALFDQDREPLWRVDWLACVAGGMLVGLPFAAFILGWLDWLAGAVAGVI